MPQPYPDPAPSARVPDQAAVVLSPPRLAKRRTGIEVFDTISEGGLPAGRASLLIGSAGSGKTIFAMQALYNAASRGEAGIFVCFEERPEDLRVNLAGFGWDLSAHEAAQRLQLIDAQTSVEAQISGDSEITGLLAIVADLARRGGAQWVVFDSLDAMLSPMADEATRGRETMRLHHWIQTSGLTCIITLKRAADWSVGFGSEAAISYLVDCVIDLATTVSENFTQRTLQILKYRGSAHHADPLPFLIGQRGFEIVPVIAERAEWTVSDERLSTGIPALDQMLGGGVLRGSGVLISGAPGTAKTSISGRMTEAMCERGERALMICFDEGPAEIVRNLHSIGIRLERHLADGRLQMASMSARSRGADHAFAAIYDLAVAFRPSLLVIDPISSLIKAGGELLAARTLTRIVHLCKQHGSTLVMPCLNVRSAAVDTEESLVHASTAADVWIHLSYLVNNGERNRLLTVIKARGTAHSNQVRELLLKSEGITLAAPYTEEGEVLAGTLRWQREEQNRIRQREREREVEAARHALAARRKQLLARIADLEGEIALLDADAALHLRQSADAEIDRKRQRMGILERRSGALAGEPSSREEGQ